MKSIKLPSWHKTGFASNVNDLLSRVGIITRPLGFATRGYSRLALRSLRTSHSFGRPDLASELPLVPRVDRNLNFAKFSRVQDRHLHLREPGALARARAISGPGRARQETISSNLKPKPFVYLKPCNVYYMHHHCSE